MKLSQEIIRDIVTEDFLKNNKIIHILRRNDFGVIDIHRTLITDHPGMWYGRDYEIIFNVFIDNMYHMKFKITERNIMEQNRCLTLLVNEEIDCENKKL